MCDNVYMIRQERDMDNPRGFLPDAVFPQSDEWYEEFYQMVRKDQPTWSEDQCHKEAIKMTYERMANEYN